MNLTSDGVSGGVVKSAIMPGRQVYYYSGRYSYMYYIDSITYYYNGNPTYLSGYANQANQRIGAARLIQTDGTGTTAANYLYHSDDMFDLHSSTYDMWAYQYQFNRIRVGRDPNSYYPGYWSSSGDASIFDIENTNKRSTIYLSLIHI